MKFTCQILIKFSLAISVISFVSCGSKSTTVTQKKVRSGLDKYNNGYDLGKGNHGMNQSQSTKRSQYDNLRTSALGGNVKKTDYRKDTYRSKRWGKESDYGKKSYANSESYQKTSYKAAENTSFEKGYNAGSSRFDGETFGTSNSTIERQAGYVKTGSSGYVQSRENVPDPTIFSREEFNQLNIQQSNALLGR